MYWCLCWESRKIRGYLASFFWSLNFHHLSLITQFFTPVWHHHPISITQYFSPCLWASYLSQCSFLFCFFVFFSLSLGWRWLFVFFFFLILTSVSLGTEKKKKKKLYRLTSMGPQIVWKILSDGNWVMMSNGCEKLSDEWWVMSYGNWVMEKVKPNRL